MVIRTGRTIKIYGTIIEPKSIIHNHKRYYLSEAYLTKERAEDGALFNPLYKKFHTIIKEAKSFKPAWCVYIREK